MRQPSMRSLIDLWTRPCCRSARSRSNIPGILPARRARRDLQFRVRMEHYSRSVVYGLFIGVALFVAARLVPGIMGREYEQSIVALRWLCVLPAIKSVHALLTDTLTGADYQWQRSMVQIVVAAFNIILNLWIIRAYAWRGAAWSSVITDLLLAILLYLVIRSHLRREHGGAEARVAQPILATREE